MKLKLLASFIVVCVLLIMACKHDPFAVPVLPGNTPNNPGGNPPPVTNDSVSFQTEVLPILQSNCAMSGCHAQNNPQKNIRLNSYANVRHSGVIEPGRPDKCALVEMIEENDEDKRMPPPPSSRLSQAQITLIMKWISEGARNTNIIRCDTTDFSFASVNSIISTSCIGCHGSSSPSGGINLTNHTGIKNVAQSGKLICAIEHGGGCSPMPQGGSKLEGCKITIIKKWTAAGYPQ